MDRTFEQAREFFEKGLAAYQAGRFEQAQAQFEASLSLVPGRASTLTNLGATRIRLGKFADAAAVLEEAVGVDPSDAQAWGHLATALAELGEAQRAFDAAGEALQRDPKLAPVWTLRGTLLRTRGDNAEAARCFRQAMLHGGDPALNGYYLAAVAGGELPDAAPRAYVQALFDGYAEGFEQHLVDVLRYRAPAILARGLAARRFEHALDLGCGTGLMGAQLRARSARMTGVDLSASMVEQARRRGVYDDVVHSELLDFLASTADRFDLVVAADVFIYLGDLQPVFAAVKKVLAPGGVFAFTVELAGDSQRICLQPSLRYAHSRNYVDRLARQTGFVITATEEHPVREDEGVPIAGLFAWLAPA